MLNPSVEPKARRESAQARRDSEGRQRRDSAGRRSSGGRSSSGDIAARAQAAARALGGAPAAPAGSISAGTSAAAEEARNQRRSKGLKVRPSSLLVVTCSSIYTSVSWGIWRIGING